MEKPLKEQIERLVKEAQWALESAVDDEMRNLKHYIQELFEKLETNKENNE